MAADILIRLLAVNLAAAAAILLVLALRRPARRLIGPGGAYALWLIVPVAMVAALAPARTNSLPLPDPAPLRPAAVTLVEQLVQIQQPAAPAAPAAATLPGLDLAPWLLGAWIGGAIVLILLTAFGQYRAIMALGLLARDRRGYFRAANVVAGPALIGLLRPIIVLPSDFELRFAPGEQAMILAHERTHLRSGHLWINALIALVRAVNWFNPLIHIGAHFARLDQELACDAAVVERFPGERRTYAQAMLKSQLTGVSLPLGCSWPARSNPMLKERIEMLAISKPNLVRRLAGGCAITTLCAAAGLGAWASLPPEVIYEPSAAAADVPAPTAEPAISPLVVLPETPVMETAETPEAPAQAGPPRPVLNQGMADVNLGAPVTLSGTVTMVAWVNPSVSFTVRDATGQDHKVISGAPNWFGVTGGMQRVRGLAVTIEGYASADGKSVYASPLGMMVGGALAYPEAEARLAAVAQDLADRDATCGPPPVVRDVTAALSPEMEALTAYQSQCRAKRGQAPATPPAGAIIQQSPFTNSVIRQGGQ